MQANERKPATHGGSIDDAATTRTLPALVALMLLAAALLVAGCGGERGDANATTGNFKVKVVSWRFPKQQPLGKPQNFTIVVRNVDSQAIPQLVLTVRGLREFVKQPGTASNTRPIWLPNEVNYANVTPNSTSTGTTYSLGKLDAGQRRSFTLPMTPIRRGEHSIGYVLAGNIYGTAKVELEDGNPASDQRTIAIDPTPVFDERVFD